jgi:putative hydrolase of the HAD superfamily
MTFIIPDIWSFFANLHPMKYKHLFFDLDHTLWDFEANSRLTLAELYQELDLRNRGIHDFDSFHRHYLVHNDKLWERYRNGFIKVDELRWKRMWLSLLEFRIADEALAREMGGLFLEKLPTHKTLFPFTTEILDYLQAKKYQLHLITNGFEKTQHSKLKNAGLAHYFTEVITSEASNSLKPHREIFDYALQKTTSQCHECIMIGDSIEVDIQGAMNAGIDQVFVNHTGLTTTIQPTFTVTNLKELESIF